MYYYVRVRRIILFCSIICVMLYAIAQENKYDKEIIEKCNNFVDCVFDTYFSVRTSAQQFAERQNILKSVKWEKYTAIQEDFKLLAKLSE